MPMDPVPVHVTGKATSPSDRPDQLSEEDSVPLTASSTPGVFTDLDSGRHYLEIDQHLDGSGVLHMYREIGSERTFFSLETIHPPEAAPRP